MVKRNKLLVIRYITTRDVMYNVMTTANTTVKLLTLLHYSFKRTDGKSKSCEFSTSENSFFLFFFLFFFAVYI